MRILVANPNTSSGVTARLVAAGRLAASPGTELVPMTAPHGVAFISSAAESAIAGAVLLEMLAERHGTVDAAIIAAFADPALAEARHRFDAPVVGMAEAALTIACTLGRKFAIVSFARVLEPFFAEIVAAYGLSDRCASIRTAGEGFASLADVQDEKEQLLVALANRAVDEDGAEAVILAGAPLAGLAGKVRGRVPVPLIDGMAAAVATAEQLVHVRSSPSAARS